MNQILSLTFLSAFLAFTFAGHCDYEIINSVYTCLLSWENAFSSNITGIHLPNYTDNDVLRVEKNKFKRFDVRSLNNLIPDKFCNLQVIILRNCRIDIVTDNAFENSSNLLELDLSENLLTKFNQTIPSLEILRISFNQLSAFSDQQFDISGLHRLEELYAIQCNLLNINENTFLNKSALKIVDLSFNKIESFDFYVFYFNRNIQSINLNNNRIKKLNFTKPINHRNLETLYLRENLLSAFPLNFLKYFPNLKTLDLSKNLIVTLEASSQIFSIIENIYFDENKINRIERTFLRSFPNYKNISFTENPCVNKSDPENLNICYENFEYSNRWTNRPTTITTTTEEPKNDDNSFTWNIIQTALMVSIVGACLFFLTCFVIKFLFSRRRVETVSPTAPVLVNETIQNQRQHVSEINKPPPSYEELYPGN